MKSPAVTAFPLTSPPPERNVHGRTVVAPVTPVPVERGRIGARRAAHVALLPRAGGAGGRRPDADPRGGSRDERGARLRLGGARSPHPADATGVCAARIAQGHLTGCRPRDPRGPRRRRGGDTHATGSRTGRSGGVTDSRGAPGLRRTVLVASRH